MAQIKGKLTHHRYTCATIFVDHCPDLIYVVLQKGLTGKEKKEAKEIFEAYCKHREVEILHYHADNGRFVDNDL